MNDPSPAPFKSRGRRTFIAGFIELLIFDSVRLLAICNSFFVPPGTITEIEADRAWSAR